MSTGASFLDHIPDQIARHSVVDLDVSVAGDTHIGDHHAAEDVGITLGQAIAKVIGNKKGIVRYGYSYVPLDEALPCVVIDFPGRPGLEFHVSFTRARVGNFNVDPSVEFLRGLVNRADATLYTDNLYGVNTHHWIEAVFKAFDRALRMAVEIDPHTVGAIPSTKGAL